VYALSAIDRQNARSILFPMAENPPWAPEKEDLEGLYFGEVRCFVSSAEMREKTRKARIPVL